jgi:L-lactate dehydrogenase complex protein LldE
VFLPGHRRDTLALLRRLGLKADYPQDQTCCGQWAFNLGQRDAARSLARHFVRVFESSPAVVCPSGSCVLTVRSHYPQLFADRPDWLARCRAVGEKTYEITDFLVNVLGLEDIGATFPGRATLHDSCHPLRGLGLKDEPRKLLKAVRGLELAEMAEPETAAASAGPLWPNTPPCPGHGGGKGRSGRGHGSGLAGHDRAGLLDERGFRDQGAGRPHRAVHLVRVLAGR